MSFRGRSLGTDKNWFARRPSLTTVWEFRQRLRALFERRTHNPEALLGALQEWCRDAEATGIRALQQFAVKLKGYRLRMTGDASAA